MTRLNGFLISLLLSTVAAAQSPDSTINTAVVTNPRTVMIVFSRPLTASKPAPHFDIVRVRLLPENVMPTSIVQNPLAPDAFTVSFPSVPAAATRICFDQVQFSTETGVGTSSAQVCGDLSRDPASLKESWITAFQDVPRTSRDKDLFASGFVTTASDQSTGGVDLSLNPRFNTPNLNAFIQIKKATADEGDARNFQAGARYRYTLTWKPQELREIASETDDARLNDLIRARQRNISAGWLIDVAGKLEGDPTSFDVTNFVGESALQLRTMTKGFQGRRGFWRGFVLPGGVEVGQSLGTTLPPVESAVPEGSAPVPAVNRIARYKAGAGLTVYFDNPGAQLPLRRIELDVNGVLRHLFLSESRFNAETKKTDSTDAGLQGYAQIDLKVFVGETNAGRYGFKLSFNRGRLPPVYAEVKSVDFGFVIESGDGDTAARAAGASARSDRR